MTLRYYASFERDYRDLPEDIQRRVDDAILLFEQNPRHPSLRIKKMKGKTNVWEGRVSRNYRFTFEWENDVVTFRRVGTHQILDRGE